MTDHQHILKRTFKKVSIKDAIGQLIKIRYIKLKPKQYIVWSQLILGISLLICVAIIPHYFFSLNQGGVSNYGTEDHTRWLYVFGFGAATIGTVLAAVRLKQARKLQINLYILSFAYFLVLISTFPYKSSPAYKNLHIITAVALFWVMLFIAGWIRSNFEDGVLKKAFIIFFLGFVIASLTFVGLIHILFTSQIICGVSFGYMLARCLNYQS